MSTIYLAGGCFWGCQKYFDLMDGVTETEVGYANGPIERPSYEQVKAHAGHAETVRIAYDPAVLPLRALLEKYFAVIDPTAVNHQGGDFGIQYRTGIYYTDPADAPIIDAALADLAQQYDRPLAIEHLPLQNFYPAEEYHQKYLEKHPDGYCHIHFD
ncbi:MAG: peptide-methionine (S)-S-oxide reductase MsrA [Clostridia bacterium]|nr:peptide-methionine (S)-S-oxide reductase MsrA [Clostridia bacterium]